MQTIICFVERSLQFVLDPGEELDDLPLFASEPSQLVRDGEAEHAVRRVLDLMARPGRQLVVERQGTGLIQTLAGARTTSSSRSRLTLAVSRGGIG